MKMGKNWQKYVKLDNIAYSQSELVKVGQYLTAGDLAKHPGGLAPDGEILSIIL